MTRFVVVLVALFAGIAAGSTVAYREYGAREARFGPFDAEEGFNEQALRERLAQQSAESAPVAELPGGDSYDFGTMYRGAEGEHAFVIRNTGNAPLDLEVTGSSCKCTVGDLEDGLLAPGEETLVHLRWTARTGSTSFGQNATLQTNDPLRSEIQLKVTGKVVDAVLAEPSGWALDDVTTDGLGELKTTFYVFDERPFRVLSAGWQSDALAELSEHEFIERSIDPETEPSYRLAKRAFDLVIRVAPGIKQGGLQDSFRVRYTLSEDPEPAVEDIEVSELMLSANVVGPISLIGGSRLKTDQAFRYALGETTAGEPLERKLYVVVRGPVRDEVKLTVSHTDPAEALVAELGEPRERENSVMYPLVMRIPADAPASAKRGQGPEDFGSVTLDPGHEGVAPVKVFVTYTISPR